jgi:hypothetical protein
VNYSGFPASACHWRVTAAKIRVMPGRAIRATSRIVFFLCGVIALITAAPFVLLRGVDLPVQSEWIIFVAALGLVGLFSLTMAALPRSLIAKMCKRDRDDRRLYLAPLKWLGSFAGMFYLLALLAHLAPHQWNLDPQLMFSVCPLYLLRMTFDPSLLAAFLLLGPMNAAAYGALGLMLGYAWLVFRGRR